MSYVDYEKAQKMGLKTYRVATIKGRNPYLPVLDEILKVVDIQSEVNLGIIHIPLNRIVGTCNIGRTYAFADNFMPILGYQTEFGAKWAQLYESHIEEGIREPIKVYEYLNYFYVEEGNKRVSVLKYCEAVTVPAQVIRKIPKKTDALENQIYYEFMDFYKQTEANYIWFSQLGGFAKLLELTETKEGEVWDEDKRKDFASAHLAFSTVFEQKGGKKLDITTGDAIIIFLNIYGYKGLKEMSYDEIRYNINKIWEEFLMIEDGGATVDIALQPPEEKKNILKSIFSSSNKITKVAFIYSKEPDESDWLYGHELGRNHLDDKYNGRIKTYKVTNVNSEEDVISAMEDLISMGVNIIFTTAATMVGASLKVAVEYPDIKILNCSLNTSHRYIRTYYARLYEAKFLTGMIAGALTDTDKIGYLADYPIFGVTADVNAFAMGAAFVNPRAKVYLEWTRLKNNNTNQLYDKFKDNNIKIISDQAMITPNSASRRFGLYGYMDNEYSNLATPVYNWGKFYEELIESILSGTWKISETESLGKAINYWWGISAGVVDIILSSKLPVSTKRLVATIKELIKNQEFDIFKGPLFSQEEVLVKEEGTMTPDEIMKMNWLAENVIGEIPALDEFLDDAKDIIRLKGVLPTTK